MSLPATGQGIELGWAEYANVPILCVYEEKATISSSLKYITDKFIKYKSKEEMINKIEKHIEFFNT